MSLTTTMYTIEHGHTFHMMVSHRSSECVRRSDYVVTVLSGSVEDRIREMLAAAYARWLASAMVRLMYHCLSWYYGPVRPHYSTGT